MSIEFPEKYYKISTAYKYELKDNTFYALLLEGKDHFDVYKYMSFSSPLFINAKGDIVEASSFAIKDICNISTEACYTILDSFYDELIAQVSSVLNIVFSVHSFGEKDPAHFIVKLKNIVTQYCCEFMLNDIFYFKDPLIAFQFRLKEALDKIS